jgi:hypothetical protein
MERKIKRAFPTFVLMFVGLCVHGQDALGTFTNRADQLLRPLWGFGANEIPIYCSTNPLVRYNGAIHYCLQKAVDAYDSTNHITGDFDFPSVFRPQFAVVTNDQCVTALITNWVEVTTNYPEIMARPFKTADDPTLSADDNVRGVGLMLGTKPAVPILNKFMYANIFNVARKLRFTRPDAFTPPQTNQMCIMGLSNAFAVMAVNSLTQALPRDVTMYFTNSGTIIFANELGAGVTNSFTNGNSQVILSNQWAAKLLHAPSSFGTNNTKVLSNGTNTLALSAYNERSRQFVAPDDTNWEMNVGLPTHSWMIQVTNQVIYALLDNSSGRILDFVNFGNFGTSLDVVAALASAALMPSTNIGSPWLTNGADSSLSSPPSAGVLNQLTIATNYQWSIQNYTYNPSTVALMTNFLNGGATNINTIDCPYVPSATFEQIASWWVPTDTNQNPIWPAMHFTTDEMAAAHSGGSGWGQMQDSVVVNPLFSGGGGGAGANGQIKFLQSKTDPFFEGTMDPNNLKLMFLTPTDGSYGVWSSSNLATWTFVGVAVPHTNGLFYGNFFDFPAPVGTNAPSLFYQARRL